jgi:hypothetical protein
MIHREEENCYIQLMCDITADLLQRNLCTNGNMKEIIAIYIRKSKKKFTVTSLFLSFYFSHKFMVFFNYFSGKQGHFDEKTLRRFNDT